MAPSHWPVGPGDLRHRAPLLYARSAILEWTRGTPAGTTGRSRVGRDRSGSDRCRNDSCRTSRGAPILGKRLWWRRRAFGAGRSGRQRGRGRDGSSVRGLRRASGRVAHWQPLVGQHRGGPAHDEPVVAGGQWSPQLDWRRSQRNGTTTPGTVHWHRLRRRPRSESSDRGGLPACRSDTPVGSFGPERGLRLDGLPTVDSTPVACGPLGGDGVDPRALLDDHAI